MSYELNLVQILTLTYNEAGDLELLSLHRIKNRIQSMQINPAVKEKIITELVRENNEYRENSGNNWMCITPSSLYNAIDNVVLDVREQVDLGLSTVDNIKIRQACGKIMHEKVDTQATAIKKWFYDNYDDILYDMNGKIPFPIVRKMRDELGQWVLENTNPFARPIIELIEEVASSVGIDTKLYDSYEDIWKALKKYS